MDKMWKLWCKLCPHDWKVILGDFRVLEWCQSKLLNQKHLEPLFINLDGVKAETRYSIVVGVVNPLLVDRSKCRLSKALALSVGQLTFLVDQPVASTDSAESQSINRFILFSRHLRKVDPKTFKPFGRAITNPTDHLVNWINFSIFASWLYFQTTLC